MLADRCIPGGEPIGKLWRSYERACHSPQVKSGCVVMLILKPKGRGNWASVTLHVDGARVTPLSIVAGQLLTLGGIVWRICKVSP